LPKNGVFRKITKIFNILNRRTVSNNQLLPIFSNAEKRVQLFNDEAGQMDI
jgi:hypothetical protein